MNTEVEEPEAISIEGDSVKSRKYEDVKKAVVLINGKYFYKHDNNRVVQLVDPKSGKKRYFRINSPLIAKDSDTGEYLFKADMYLTEDQVYLNKNSTNVVEIKGKYYRKAFCTKVGDEYYLKTDERLTKCPATGYLYLKGTGIAVNKDMYGYDEVHPTLAKTKKLSTGENILSADYYEYVNSETGELQGVNFRTIKGASMVNILYAFQDKTNPQEDRLTYKPAKAKDVEDGMKDGTWVQITLLPGQEAKHYVHKTMVNYFKEQVESHILPRYLTKLSQIREALNKNYSDLDDNENRAKIFQVVPKPFPGKHIIHQPKSYGVPIRSKTFSKTGGFEYSFGIEFETSQGLIQNDEILGDLGLLAVGDRSVGAGEYVTSPMMGDKGIDMIKDICDLLNQNTLVDDKCGLHVHIGSLFTPGKDGDEPKVKQSPSWNKQFVKNSINLGAFIEEELFKSLPKNRVPTLYHCHSIRRFAPFNDPVTSDNFDERVGAYLFGPKEWWFKPNDQCHEQLFDFEDYKLGPDRNKKSQLGVWPEGRYKWLNMIPTYTATKHRTIEFRIFSATTNFEKTYAYLLTAIAFTNIADNHADLIKPGVTLSQLFEVSFKRYPDTVKFLNDFYDKRKAKFNRENIYCDLKGKPLDLPFLK